jgi:hypothetical protein
MKSRKKHSNKKSDSTFLKRPLDSLALHIGKIVDNSTVRDVAEVALMASLAYMGWERLGGLSGAVLGPISLKLATSPQNAISQIAGVGGLAFLGASYGVTVPSENLDTNKTPFEAFWETAAKKQCPDGYILDWNVVQGWYCKPKTQPTP